MSLSIGPTGLNNAHLENGWPYGGISPVMSASRLHFGGKQTKRGHLLDLLLELMLSESANADEVFQSSNPNSRCHLHQPRHIKHYWYHSICISMHSGSQLDNLTCQLNIPSYLATAQRSHEHLPITASSLQMSHFTKINLNHCHKQNSFPGPRRSALGNQILLIN